MPSDISPVGINADKIEHLFWVYYDLKAAVKSEGINNIMHDIQKYHPDMYAMLDSYFFMKYNTEC